MEPLAPEAWSRAATVTGAGKPLVRTGHTYVQWLARYERPHVKQIERIVNTMRMQQRLPLEQAARLKALGCNHIRHVSKGVIYEEI